MSLQQPSFVTPPVGGKGRGPFGLLLAGLRRPGGRQASSILAVILLLAGIGLFSYPFITNIYEHHLQSNLKDSFRSQKFALRYLDELKSGSFKVGEGSTELIIPKIHLDVLVVEGTTPSALRAGAGHYVGTAVPCFDGNVAIAGHRTTFGHPFNQLDQMAVGDLITLKTPIGQCTYKVEPTPNQVPAYPGPDPHPVLPTDTSVIAPPLLPNGKVDTRVSELTLTTCHPKGSAAFRLVLRAVLVSRTLNLPPGVTLTAPRETGGTAPPTLPGD